MQLLRLFGPPWFSTGWTGLIWVTQGATDAEYVSFLDRYYAGNATRYTSLNKPTAITDVINSAIYEPDYAKRVALSQQAVQMMADELHEHQCLPWSSFVHRKALRPWMPAMEILRAQVSVWIVLMPG